MTHLLKSLRRCAGELSPSCREAVRLQSKALDQPLPRRQQIGLRIHLWLCRWCQRYGKQLRFLRSAAHCQDEHAQILPPQSLRPEARARIKQRLNSEKTNPPPVT